MMRFRLTDHNISNNEVVEILDWDGRLVAVLYAAEDGVRLVSKHLTQEKIKYTAWDRNGIIPLPPSLEVKLP